MTKIPTDEEFEHADRMDKEMSKNLNLIHNNIKEYFEKKCQLYSLYVMPQAEASFMVIVFFKTNSDLKECQNNGITQKIIDYTYEQLEKYDRGKKNEITVDFEFDSDENVENNFNGDYFLRLR